MAIQEDQPPTSVLPSEERVREACQEFDEEYATTEHALRDLFHQYPTNDNEAHVLLKVVTLNTLYSTNILAVHDVAHHIHSQDVDSDLRVGAPDIVDRIAKVTITTTGKERNNWSFATKYCSWHNPASYPIWDSRVQRYLRSLKGTPFEHPDNWTHYREFVNLMASFRASYGLSKFTFREIDKFLYLHGGEQRASVTPGL